MEALSVHWCQHPTEAGRCPESQGAAVTRLDSQPMQWPPGRGQGAAALVVRDHASPTSWPSFHDGCWRTGWICEYRLPSSSEPFTTFPVFQLEATTVSSFPLETWSEFRAETTETVSTGAGPDAWQAVVWILSSIIPLGLLYWEVPCLSLLCSFPIAAQNLHKTSWKRARFRWLLSSSLPVAVGSCVPRGPTGFSWGVWLAHLVERATLDLRIVSLGVGIT